MSEVLSGGLILETSEFTAPFSITPTLPLIETWPTNHANDLTGDYPWVQFIGGTGWGVSGGRAVLTGQGTQTQAARLNVDAGTDDYAVTVTVPTWSPAAGSFLVGGPCIRMQGTTAYTFYAAPLLSGTPTTLALYKFVAGVQTQIGGPVTVSPHENMTVQLQGIGADLTVLVDGTSVITATDSDILTGRYGGIEGVGPGASLVAFDDCTVATPWTLANYTLTANRGVLSLHGSSAGFQFPGAWYFGAATGHLTMTGFPIRLPLRYFRANTGALHLTGRASTIRTQGVAGNVLHGNPWVITQAGTLTAARTRIVAVRWVGATAIGHRVVITDARGKRIWSSVADTGYHTEYDYLDGRLYTGVVVPTLDSGVLEIEVA